ncbi:hypothetical protein COV11_04540 [Candidatus Woesearchaeota archaeon CG10_big_fil_rev_8_21_14_0_10_30_7]|nr:MAG: hypothetical protein COV11_04540 [Candidatus Woesearchaeota archaeon CG10_big_fil_rev_8_21_14_0_10_30_7]
MCTELLFSLQTREEESYEIQLIKNRVDETPEIIDCYSTRKKPIHGFLKLISIGMNSSIVGLYLATKYENDPALWKKLKNLRTLEDLTRLVE